MAGDVNRSLAIVTLKQPFADWLNQLPDHGDIDWNEPALESIQVVLLPEEAAYDDDMAQMVMERYWHKIAFSIFDSWVTDESQWPKDFSLKQFTEWFDVQLIDSPIFDLVDEPLEASD